MSQAMFEKPMLEQIDFQFHVSVQNKPNWKESCKKCSVLVPWSTDLINMETAYDIPFLIF